MATIATLLFLAGGVGASVSLVMIVVNILRRKPKKKSSIALLVCCILFIVSIIIFPSNSTENQNQNPTSTPSETEANTEAMVTETESQTETTETESAKASSEPETTGKSEKSEAETLVTEPVQQVIEYDQLQQLFLNISVDLTEDEWVSIITDSGLPNTSKEYKGSKAITYKIAYEEDVATQYKAKTGDYIEATFSMEDGSLKYAEYFNAQAWYNSEIYQAVLYVKGTYWDFRETGMDGDYSGYYGHKQDFKNEDGIVIKYTNGNEAKTNYFLFESVEELIQCIIENAQK